MLKAIFNWFSHKNPSHDSHAPTVRPEAVPYKVEAVNSQPLVKEAAPVAAVQKPAAIKTPAKKAAAKKPPAKKATAKKSS